MSSGNRDALFDCTPKASYLIAAASMKWNSWGAISELVDNSFGALRGNAKHVLIIFNKSKRTLSVLDDGVGMDHIGRLFQLGSTIGMGPGDIGKYGSGGTLALLWLADKIRIWTMRDGKRMYDTVTWADYTDSFPQVSNEWVPASLRNTPTQLYEARHGTLIELHLRPERTINSDTVQRELSRIYSPGLRHGKVLKWLTISRVRDSIRTLQGEPFERPDDPKKLVDFNLNVRYHDKLLPVTGTVALIEGLPYKESFVSVGFGARVIFQTRACYESSDGQRKYGGAGVAGWLDLGEGWQDFLTTTKDDIRDDTLRAALMHHVFEKIEPLLKQTEEDRLSIVLEGISLDLTMAFNNLSDLDIVESEEEVPAVIRVIYPTLTDNPKPFEPFDGDPKVVEIKRVKKPPQSRVKLEPVPDEAMDGALCRLQILSEHETDLRVEINKDHEVVTELLRAKPINKMGLNLMVTREIAASLCDHPQILKRALAPKVLRKLEQFSDNSARERAFARLLMDSAVRPNISEAA